MVVTLWVAPDGLAHELQHPAQSVDFGFILTKAKRELVHPVYDEFSARELNAPSGDD